MRRILRLTTLCAIMAPLAAYAAWPTTPLTTYVPGTTPAIKAFDLNSFQSAINRAFLGTYSYRGIVVDGTGGAAATPVPGSVIVTRTTTGTAYPTASHQPGELTRSVVPLCWAQVKANGTDVFRGANILETGRYPAGLANGDYYVDCDIALSDFTTAGVFVTPWGALPRMASVVSLDNGAGKLRLHVLVFNTAGTATDTIFNVVAYGE